MKKTVTAIGLMSGTSMDGVDVALIHTDGEGSVERGPAAGFAYHPEERALIRAALTEAVGLNDRMTRTPALRAAEEAVTAAHVRAVEAFLTLHPSAARAELIGFHGQTVYHRPEAGLTVQIGLGEQLAKALGVPVVYDMRAADVAAGGQGAPLVPVYHRALVRQAGLAEPVAVLNIGGVSNVTFVQGETLIACDCGPGGALLDDLMEERTGTPMDRDGLMAALGEPDEALLARWLSHRFFAEKPPKSLDRNAFSRAEVNGLSTPDAAASLTAFTARAVAAVIAHLPVPPRQWIVCGGGARNPTLMRMLEAAVKAPVVPAEAYGWSVEAMEAEAFAFLAVRALKGLPLTFPGTTGVSAPLTGGVLARP